MSEEGKLIPFPGVKLEDDAEASSSAGDVVDQGLAATPVPAEPMKKLSLAEATAALEASAAEARQQAAMDADKQHIRGPQEEQGPQTVKINPKAVITWYDKDGKVTGQESMYRSFTELADYLENAVEVGRSLEDKVEIHLQLIDCFIKPPKEDPDQKPRTKLTIRSGKLGDVIDYLRSKIVEPQAVLLHLQSLVYSLADVSSLKGVIISVVMADARAAGFGFVSESSEVTDQDIQVLGAAAAAQTDMFKAKMKELRKVEFPDESPIVPASPGELLKLTNGRGVKG